MYKDVYISHNQSALVDSSRAWFFSPSFTVILISSQGHEGTVGIALDSHEPQSGVSGSVLHNFVISFRHVQQGLSSQEKQTPTLKGQKTHLPVHTGAFSYRIQMCELLEASLPFCFRVVESLQASSLPVSLHVVYS